MEKIRLEYVGDITFTYPYLEAFVGESKVPFLDVGITEDKKLSFKFYAQQTDVLLSVDDWEYILTRAKEFCEQSLKNEEYFLKFLDK